MPTRPPSDLLEIDQAKALTSSTRGAAQVCLTEVVSEGLAALVRGMGSAQGHDENLAIFSTYRSVIDCIDGARELIEECCDTSAQIILRSAFESWLSLRYLLEADTKNRGYAWMVCNVERRRLWYETLGPSSSKGKALRAIEKDRYQLPILAPITDEIVKAQIAKFDSLRDKPLWKEAYAEWDRMRKRPVTPEKAAGGPSDANALAPKPPRRPAWHSFYNGPGNIESLADHLGESHSYQVLYRSWSNQAHAGDLVGGFKTKGDLVLIDGLRQSAELPIWASFAIMYGVSSIRQFLYYYRSEEITGGTFANWYIREIKPEYRKVDARSADGLVPTKG